MIIPASVQEKAATLQAAQKVVESVHAIMVVKDKKQVFFCGEMQETYMAALALLQNQFERGLCASARRASTSC